MYGITCPVYDIADGALRRYLDDYATSGGACEGTPMWQIGKAMFAARTGSARILSPILVRNAARRQGQQGAGIRCSGPGGGCINLPIPNRVVHGAGDAVADARNLHGSIEYLIHRILSHYELGPLMMYVAKASVAETLDDDALDSSGCHEAAVEQSKRVKGGDQAFVLHSRGHSLAALDRDSEALEAYDAAIGIDPTNAAAHVGRGDVLAALDRDSEALEAYDRAIGIDQGDAFAHSRKGLVLHWMDRNAEALKSYDRAIDLDPDFAPFHSFRGDALAALGRDDEAHAAREAASRLSDNADRA